MIQTAAAMTNDPYEPPTADPALQSSPDASHSPDAPPVVVEHLVHTRPWVKFCSISGYVASAFFIIIGSVSVLNTIKRASLQDQLLLSGTYLILAILFLIPSIWLSIYARSITRLQKSNGIEDLEQAIAHQRTFWRQMAIMILILLAIYLLSIAFSAFAILSTR